LRLVFCVMHKVLHNRRIIALEILLYDIAVEYPICLWQITQQWSLPLVTDFLPHVNAQKVCSLGDSLWLWKWQTSILSS